MACKKFRKIEYEVTGAFGDSPPGEIREAFVILEDSCGGSALIFHPKVGPYFCGSIEMAHDRGDGVYVSSNGESDTFGFVNIEGPTDLAALAKNVKLLKYRSNPS